MRFAGVFRAGGFLRGGSARGVGPPVGRGPRNPQLRNRLARRPIKDLPRDLLAKQRLTPLPGGLL